MEIERIILSSDVIRLSPHHSPPWTRAHIPLSFEGEVELGKRRKKDPWSSSFSWKMRCLKWLPQNLTFCHCLPPFPFAFSPKARTYWVPLSRVDAGPYCGPPASKEPWPVYKPSLASGQRSSLLILTPYLLAPRPKFRPEPPEWEKHLWDGWAFLPQYLRCLTLWIIGPRSLPRGQEP